MIKPLSIVVMTLCLSFLGTDCVIVPKQPNPPSEPSANGVNQIPPASTLTQRGAISSSNGSGVDGYTVSGVLDVKVGACTKMGCSQDNPCCNKCQSEMSLRVNSSNYPENIVGKTVLVRNHGCQANECGQLPNCDMSHGQNVELNNISSVFCESGENCIAQLIGPIGEGVGVAGSPGGQTSQGVALTGKIISNSTCTLVGCPPDKPCCNACTPMVSIKPLSGPHRGKDIMLQEHGCQADGCGKLKGCALKNDGIVTLPSVVVTCEGNEPCVGVVQQ